MTFKPRYIITPKMAKNLMKIQEANTLVKQLPLPGYILKELQHQSKVETIILSTKIEGNFLDEKRKRDAIKKPGNALDEQEIHNLWKAMDYLEDCEQRKLPITEEFIKKLHAIIQVIPAGRRPKLSEYRTVQNKVGVKGDRSSIVYLPPEPGDVPTLMEDLVAWVNAPETLDLPAPIKAGIFLFEFLTIHPYLDGNGRTGRALATYILKIAGLDLNGLFVLESYYDRNLQGYYENLQLGLHHNYYFGRNEADLTPWLDFFISGLNEVFNEAKIIVQEKSAEFTAVEPPLLKELDADQRAIFAQLTFKRNHLTTTDIVRLLGLANRTVRDRVKKWIDIGFLKQSDPDAKRVRTVTLSDNYQKLSEEILDEPDKYRYLLR